MCHPRTTGINHQPSAAAVALAAVQSAGSNPILQCFPQGAIIAFDRDLMYLTAGGLGLGDVGLSREMLEGKTNFGHDFRYEMVNPAMCAFTGYSELELTGRSMVDIAHPGDIDADLAAMAGLLTNERVTYSMDKRFRTATGSIVWGAKSVTLVRREDGLPLHFIAQIQDITFRKLNEQALLNERRRLRDAESIGRVGSWDLDLQTGLITWSRGLYELWGLDPDRVDDLDAARNQIHPDDLFELDAALQECRPHGFRPRTWPGRRP